MSSGEEQAKAYLEHVREHPHERKALEHALLEDIVEDARKKGYDFSVEDLMKLPQPERVMSSTWHV